MEVSELFSLENLTKDTEVTIEGIFVLTLGVGYLVQSKDEMAIKHRAILVDFPDLEKHLRGFVPGYAGSKYIYCNEAVISGVLKERTTFDFPYALQDIHNFTIYINGESIRVDI